MAGLVVTCTSCGLKMNAPASKRGGRWLCPSCNAVVTALPQNTLELETTPKADTENSPPDGYYKPAADPLDNPTLSDPPGDCCGRCGKAFKGDWDRNDTVMGVLCHRCSRMAQDPGETALLQNDETPPQVRDPESYFPMEPIEPIRRLEDEVPRVFKEHPKLFKRIITGAAIAVVGLAVIMLLFPEFDLGSAEPRNADAEPELSTSAFVLLSWTSSFLGYALAIYAVLFIYDRLNLFEALTNSLYILLMSAVLAALTTTGAYGTFYGTLGRISSVFSLLITAAIIWAAFDLGFLGTLLVIVFATLFGLAAGGAVQAIIT